MAAVAASYRKGLFCFLSQMSVENGPFTLHLACEVAGIQIQVMLAYITMEELFQLAVQDIPAMTSQLLNTFCTCFYVRGTGLFMYMYIISQE